MSNINNLPTDVICIISNFLSIKEVCILQKTCKNLYSKITSVQDPILTLHFNKLRKRGFGSKKFMYSLMHNVFINYLHNFKFNLKENGKFNSLHFKQDILNNLTTKVYCDAFTIHLNTPKQLFNKIFTWFVKNNYTNIKQYPLQFELYAFFLFYQIEICKDKTNFNMIIDFIESLDQEHFRYMRDNYYHDILYNINSLPFILTFQQMYIMSKTTISVPVFKKLIGYKILNLSNSSFNDSYNTPNHSIIFEICSYKITYWKDPLVSHNYSEFKNLLHKDNKYYYEYMLNVETTLVNDMIYIKNPETNRRMRINGKNYERVMNSFYKKDYNTYKLLVSRLNKSQTFFKHRYFT